MIHRFGIYLAGLAWDIQDFPLKKLNCAPSSPADMGDAESCRIHWGLDTCWGERGIRGSGAGSEGHSPQCWRLQGGRETWETLLGPGHSPFQLRWDLGTTWQLYDLAPDLCRASRESSSALGPLASADWGGTWASGGVHAATWYLTRKLRQNPWLFC